MRTALLIAMLMGGSVLLPGADGLSNRRAPGFCLPDVKLKRFDLQDYRGKVVLISFIQSSCPHCAELAKTLEQVAAKYKDKVQVLSVVIYPPENQDTVSKFIQENGISYPILFDSSQMAASYMDSSPGNARFEVPHLFVIDAQGQIRHDYGHDEEGLMEMKNLSLAIDSLQSHR